MTTVVVAGALANKPGNGGEAWVRMSWARGLARLGFDVWFVENLSPGSPAATDWQAAAGDPEQSDAVRFFERVTDDNGFGERRALRVNGRTLGMSPAEWEDLGDACDLLVNISGHLPSDPWFDRIPRRVYVDLDPGYTQIWDADGLLGSQVADHTDHYTVGLNVGRPGCDIPTGGVRWRPILQPVVLEDWADGTRGAPHETWTEQASERSGRPRRFTTVASWRGAFGPLRHGDATYGIKAHEWRRFRALPTLAPSHRFEAALAIHAADAEDRAALECAGWALEDPAARASSQCAFRDYVEHSDAEFSVAQGVYVHASSGWFSDRSVRYLAAGRPVLVQDTGFGSTIPVGEGVLAFGDMAGAVRGVDEISADYSKHARAARRLAETRFDSDIVLGAMLEDLGVST